MTNERLQEIIIESLRDWFKKEDWVKINTAGTIEGPCGTMDKTNLHNVVYLEKKPNQ